ncbi:MAG: hypothetical protein HZA92_10015 [Verrucomicrobia bacterium]|nr:hypothetical protein [Verrucomicrobiota bacterium]
MNGDDNPFDPTRWRSVRTARPQQEAEPALAGVPPDLQRVAFFGVLSAFLVLLGTLLPANWKSVHPALLARAGQGTTTAAGLGLAAVTAQRPGVANLALSAAMTVKDEQVAKLTAELAVLEAQRGWTTWGGRDPFIESVFKDKSVARPASEAILPFLLTETNRAVLREHLASARSPGVQAILKTRELSSTTQFVSVGRPGGQPFEATILLAALLYQGERFSALLAQDIRTVAEKANETRLAGEWESVCMDLLTLARRMDWIQLSELLRHVPSAKALNDFAQLAKTAPDNLAVLYTASLLTHAPDKVAGYLLRFGKTGADDLTKALGHGDGAVRLLVERSLPLGPNRVAPSFLAGWTLAAPRGMLTAKVICFLLAGFGFFLVWRELSPVQNGSRSTAGARVIHGQRAVVAIALGLMLLAAGEPFLLKPLGSPEFRARLKLPVLMNSPVPTDKTETATKTKPRMDLSTILSIVLFAGLQVAVYAICIMKIREIEMSTASPQLKMRLMENEENLFDSGLYVGIAGTATALVLQVVQVIEANLLAAYASNLFGIVTVAFVKIHHVRACKRRLILESQAEAEERETAAA